MQFKRFIPAVLLTALMTAAVGFCVPQFANKLAWIGGAHGVAPLIIFLRIASMFSAIVCLLCIALTFSFRLGRKQSVRLCKILCLLEVGWTLFSIQQTVSSGVLFQNYCRGLSQTIHSRVTNADLNAVFSAALLAAKDNGGIFYNPNPGPPFNNIFPITVLRLPRTQLLDSRKCRRHWSGTALVADLALSLQTQFHQSESG